MMESMHHTCIDGVYDLTFLLKENWAGFRGDMPVGGYNS